MLRFQHQQLQCQASVRRGGISCTAAATCSSQTSTKTSRKPRDIVRWVNPPCLCSGALLFRKSMKRFWCQSFTDWLERMIGLFPLQFFMIRSHLHFKPKFTSKVLKIFSKKLPPSTGNWTHNTDLYSGFSFSTQIWHFCTILTLRGLKCISKK